MNTDTFSGIVVYTIHDNDKLRAALRNAITEQMNAIPLDESTYGISIQGDLRNTVIDKIKTSCESAELESNEDFCSSDFVKLYYPTYREETGKESYIKQVTIIPKSLG